MASDSLQAWLSERVQAALRGGGPGSAFLLWCDPRQEWRELLATLCGQQGLQLWADPAEHELALRDRFVKASVKPAIVWLPCRRSEVTWFKVCELAAVAVWETSLVNALREYGVDIPPDQEADLAGLLPAHAREWFAAPLSQWAELTPGTAKMTLVDDRRVLEVLAGPAGEFKRLQDEDRFAIFVRRAREDFGLPDPAGQEEAAWRAAATACLLATDGATAVPQRPPREPGFVIPDGLPRNRALKLLADWQRNVDYLASFERLAVVADKQLGLADWAKHLTPLPRALASRAAEAALLEATVERVSETDKVAVLVQGLADLTPGLAAHRQGFWGTHADQRVAWAAFHTLAGAAGVLRDLGSAETQWRSVEEAVAWYAAQGWQLDRVLDELGQEVPDLPDSLRQLRQRLRQTCLRRLDGTGRAFSEVLAQAPDKLTAGKTAGEVLAAELERGKAATAIFLLDACSLYLGHALAELLNVGEPVPRATVQTALAPVPSITPLGKALALPLSRSKLRVEVAADTGRFKVQAEGFAGNLAEVAGRQEWLTRQCGIKEFYTVAEVLDGKVGSPGKGRRPILVVGDEFDTEGHEGRLELTGSAEHVQRYARAVRKLRDVGYARVIVVTDHGFFHWQPAPDEIAVERPTGEVLWQSRRAAVGRGLQHSSAVKLPVPGSDLEVVVPRSVGAFRTYGCLGFFHGGATLSEVVVPVVVAAWPVRARKVGVVLSPVGVITSQAPRVELKPGLAGSLLAEDSLARHVAVKVRDPESGKVVFKGGPVTIQPGGESIAVTLNLVESPPPLAHGSKVQVEAVDADDDELLTRETVELKVDIDDW